MNIPTLNYVVVVFFFIPDQVTFAIGICSRWYEMTVESRRWWRWWRGGVVVWDGCDRIVCSRTVSHLTWTVGAAFCGLPTTCPSDTVIKRSERGRTMQSRASRLATGDRRHFVARCWASPRLASPHPVGLGILQLFSDLNACLSLRHPNNSTWTPEHLNTSTKDSLTLIQTRYVLSSEKIDTQPKQNRFNPIRSDLIVLRFIRFDACFYQSHIFSLLTAHSFTVSNRYKNIIITKLHLNLFGYFSKAIIIITLRLFFQAYHTHKYISSSQLK